MTTWYDPQEIKDQANGAQTQPEFDPPADPDAGTVEGDRAPGMEALETRIDEIRTIIAGI